MSYETEVPLRVLLSALLLCFSARSHAAGTTDKDYFCCVSCFLYLASKSAKYPATTFTKILKDANLRFLYFNTTNYDSNALILRQKSHDTITNRPDQAKG